uniref:WD_REPEATS_REGION domain-containing protein n=1 Tax=Macrostomum lignano TaxID=282301 RepID=A0A1I8F8C5_9PLAT
RLLQNSPSGQANRLLASAGDASSSASTDAATPLIANSSSLRRAGATLKLDESMTSLRALTDARVVLRGRGGVAELREELVQLRRLREEAAVMKLTQPATQLTLTPQSTDLVLAGSLGNMGRAYVPTVSLTMRSQLTDKLSSDVTAPELKCCGQAAEGFHGKAALFLAPNDAGAR